MKNLKKKESVYYMLYDTDAMKEGEPERIKKELATAGVTLILIPKRPAREVRLENLP